MELVTKTHAWQLTAARGALGTHSVRATPQDGRILSDCGQRGVLEDQLSGLFVGGQDFAVSCI